MNRLRLACVLLAGCLFISCRTQDIRTTVVHVPEMKNRACVDLVTKAVSTLQGIVMKDTWVDPSTRTITVTFDSMQLAIKNIEFAIADAGFKANEIPANEEARKKLPPECLADEPKLDLQQTATTSAAPELKLEPLPSGLTNSVM